MFSSFPPCFSWLSCFCLFPLLSTVFLLFVPVSGVCPLFSTVFTVLICFLLLSHVFPVFLAVCFPLLHRFYLFSTVSRCFFFSFLLFYPVSLDSPFFSCFTVFFSVFMVSPQKQWIEKRRKTGENIENK